MGYSSCFNPNSKLGEERTHIETVNRRVFDTVRFYEHIVFEDDLKDVMKQFGALFTNFFKEDATARRVSVVPEVVNQTARYMALYGMENMTAFDSAPGLFGNLKEFLDRDMGVYLPFEVNENFGLGEVIDSSPPVSPAYHVNLAEEPAEQPHALAIIQSANQVFWQINEMEVDEELMQNNKALVISNAQVNKSGDSSLIYGDNANASITNESSKGKEKVLSSYAFNNNGLLSQEAIKILESKCRSSVSKFFGKNVINLDDQVSKGVYAKEVLDGAVKGKLGELMGVSLDGATTVPEVKNQGDLEPMEELMDTEEAMLQFVLFDAVGKEFGK